MDRKINIRVQEQIVEPVLKPVPVSATSDGRPPSLTLGRPNLLGISAPAPLSTNKFSGRTRNTEGLVCEDNDDLFVIGSHYSIMPIPDDQKFYKCSDKSSKFNKIDFDKLKTNPKCANIKYGEVDVRILGIIDLLKSYVTIPRKEDIVKIKILKYICKKLGNKNEYIGEPLFEVEEDEY